MLESDYLSERYNEGFLTGSGREYRPMPDPTHISLLGGSRVIPLAQYRTEFASRIDDAIARGRRDGEARRGGSSTPDAAAEAARAAEAAAAVAAILREELGDRFDAAASAADFTRLAETYLLPSRRSP